MAMNITSQVTFEPITRASKEIVTFLRVYLTIAAAVGCFGSILNIISVSVNKHLQTIPNAFLVSLSVADFIVCSFLIPMTMYTYTKSLSDLVCHFVGYPHLTILMVSVMNLGHIAVNRYVIICRSRELYMKIYTKRNTIILILGTWALGLLLFIPPFIGYGTYDRNELFGACIFKSNDPDTYFFILIFADFVVMFPVLGITVFSYASILMKFRASRKKVAAMKTQTTTNETATTALSRAEGSMSESARNDTSDGSKKEKEYDKKSRALIKNLITICMTYILLWMPLIGCYKIDYYGTWPKELYHFLFAVAESNSAANFIIYCTMNTQFRNAYKRLMTCGKYGNEI